MENGLGHLWPHGQVASGRPGSAKFGGGRRQVQIVPSHFLTINLSSYPPKGY